MMKRTRWFFPAIWGAFFLSGVAGLIYEVVWARYLDLLLGGTAYAHIMVLAAYMGGMALGAWVFGRLADRIAEPVAVYTYLELAIGTYGLLFAWLFTVAGGLYVTMAGLVGVGGVGAVLNKFLVSLLLVGPSTFLMGGTLPLLARAVTSMPDRVGRGVAGLYFINSIGAVTGALSAGFLIIPGMGLEATLATAASINIVVGIALLGCWRFGGLSQPVDTASDGDTEAGPDAGRGLEKDGAPQPESQPPPESLYPQEPPAQPAPTLREFPGADPGFLRRLATIATWGAGFSGLMVMIYEVSWIRLLSTILGSSTYSFTLMLAAFITGIALGSLIARWLARFGRPYLMFAGAMLLIGVSLLLTLPLYARLPFFFLELQDTVARTPSGYRVYEMVKYLFCLVIMIPPTLASGAALPLATDVAARLKQRVGAPVGQVYAINTLGTILGALLGGLVLLPAIGVRATLEIGIALNIAFGLFLLYQHQGARQRVLRPAAITCAGVLLLYLIAAPSWDKRALASGVFRYKEFEGSGLDAYHRLIETVEVAFYEEDVNGTVAVLLRGGDATMVVNGKADASTHIGDRITQTLISAIPAMMVPTAREALVVGLGSGQTVGHLLHYPVERVEVVEISPGVVEASRYFDSINGRPLDDPRTELVMQDARTYLLTQPDKRYDLILSEPSNPWIAGIGGLFTEEYFLGLRDRLNPGGAMAQWIHTYEQSDETLGSVLLTFKTVFPYATVWSLSNADLLLVGSIQPMEWDFEAAREAMAIPEVLGDLQRVGTRDLFSLLARQLMGPVRTAEAVSLGGRLNTNNFPYLEYQAPRAFFLDAQATLHVRFDERNRALRNTDLVLKEYLAGRRPTAEELANLVHYLEMGGETLPRYHPSAAAAWLEEEPDNPAAREAALRTGVIQQMATIAEARDLAARDPSNLRLRQLHLDALDESYNLLRTSAWSADRLTVEIRDLLNELIEADPGNSTYYYYRIGQIELDRGRHEEAVDYLGKAVEDLGIAADPTRLFQTLQSIPREAWEQVVPQPDPRTPPDQVLTLLGRALLEVDRAVDARNAFRDAFRLNPNNPIAAFYTVELDEQFSSRLYFEPPGPQIRP
jgi:predicted membrane-bound spermidine synthase